MWEVCETLQQIQAGYAHSFSFDTACLPCQAGSRPESILSRTWQRSILRQLPDCCAYFRYHFLSKLSKQLEVVLQFAHSNCCHGRWNGSKPFAWNNMATVRRKHSPLPPRCHGKFYSLPPSCFACGPYISPLVKSLAGNPLIAAIPLLGSPTDGVLHGVGGRDQHEDLQLVFLWFWQKGLGLASWPDQGRQVAIVLRPRGINLWRQGSDRTVSRRRSPDLLRTISSALSSFGEEEKLTHSPLK